MFDRPPLLEEPFAQTLSGINTLNFQNCKLSDFKKCCILFLFLKKFEFWLQMRTIIRNKNEKSAFGARMCIGIVRKYFILIFILIYFDDS